MMQWRDPVEHDRMAELDRIIASSPADASCEAPGGKKRVLRGDGRRQNVMCVECSTRFCDHVMPTVRLMWYQARVLIGLTRGWSNQELADHLRVVSQTANVYVSEICRITGLTSRLELALWAYERRAYLEGIVAAGPRRGRRKQ